MPRSALFIALALVLSLPQFLLALPKDDGPLIKITSPDTATTFAYGTVKSHTLMWNKKTKQLIAEVTFTDAELNFGQPNDDTHQFTLPGVTLDEEKGVFYALSPKGESIPIAHYKKALFFKTIETMPNAIVRILHPRGNVSVVLEAISPNDPAMHSAPADADGSHKIDLNSVIDH